MSQYAVGNADKSPITGSPFGGSRAVWALGLTMVLGPTTTQDDLAIISGSASSLTYRADNFPNTYDLASALTFDGTTARVSGVIEQVTD